MKCWSVAASRTHWRRGALAGVGLALFAALPPALAETAAPATKPEATAAKPETPAKAAPAAKPHPKLPPQPAECVRTGQRVAAALARDDSGAASQFHTFYTAFKCSPQHLAQAFGCLVGLQTKHPSISNPSPEQVSQCWEDPTTIPLVKPEPPPQPAGEAK